jgi:hypothetical protein
MKVKDLIENTRTSTPIEIWDNCSRKKVRGFREILLHSNNRYNKEYDELFDRNIFSVYSRKNVLVIEVL